MPTLTSEHRGVSQEEKMNYHVYLDEDFDDVLEGVKRELRIEESYHVDSSDTGDHRNHEPRRVLPRGRNGSRVDSVWAF